MSKTTHISITGVGVVTPMGLELDTHIDGLKNGKSALQTTSTTDEDFPIYTALVPDFDPKQYIEDRRSIRFMTRPVLFGSVSSRLALKHAGLTKQEISADEDGNGVIYGAGVNNSVASTRAAFVPCVKSDETIDYELLGSMGYRKLPPLWILPRLPNTTAGQISIQNGIKGINYSCVNGVASGMVSIGNAMYAIADQRAKRIVCGSSEWEPAVDQIHRLNERGIASVEKSGGRPFAKDSDGLWVAEGAATLVVERSDVAQERGAKRYADITGYTQSYLPDLEELDIQDIAQAYEDNMLNCIIDSGLKPEDIEVVQANACGIPKLDQAEAIAIKNIFGKGAAITATAGTIGHGLGASSSINVAYAAIQLDEGFIAPILGDGEFFENQSIDYVRHDARITNHKNVLSNCFDYFGSVCSIILQTPENKSS